jgi:hypothetical protein
MEKLKSETIENLFAALGVPLAAGRAERLAPAVNALNVDDPLRAALDFDVDATTYLRAREPAK